MILNYLDAFVLRAVSKFLKQAPENLNLIVLHLGSGASACAIKHGRSLDTSMGLTPLNGLPGATRSGAIDPSLIFHYTNRAGRITHDPSFAAHVGVTEVRLSAYLPPVIFSSPPNIDFFFGRPKTSSTANQVGNHSQEQPTLAKSPKTPN